MGHDVGVVVGLSRGGGRRDRVLVGHVCSKRNVARGMYGLGR